MNAEHEIRLPSLKGQLASVFRRCPKEEIIGMQGLFGAYESEDKLLEWACSFCEVLVSKRLNTLGDAQLFWSVDRLHMMGRIRDGITPSNIGLRQ